MLQVNYGRHKTDQKDYLEVKKVLNSNYLTQGPIVEKFEQKIKKYLNSKYATVVSSGTAALHLLGVSLGWKKKDYILTTPFSFIATANCIVYSGATPIFVDIDKNSGNICPNSLEKKIKELESKNKSIKAVIAIDYGGCPANWPEIKKIVNKKNIILINDSCHSFGAKINQKVDYALKYADFATFSFHPVKSITTGEGGAIISNNKKIDKKLKYLRSHGIIKSTKKNSWLYDMKFLGYNYRITDFQCALGINQLKKINQFIEKRRKIFKYYNQSFKKINYFKIQEIPKNYESAHHLYPLKINFKKKNLTKKKLFLEMAKKGINLQVHYIPIYRHTYYKKKYNIDFKKFPNTESFYNQVVSLPIFYDLNKKKQNFIIHTLKKIVSKK